MLTSISWNLKGRRKGTVSVDCAIFSLGNVEEMRPARDIGEVEVQVICLCEGVEVGGVEFEDVEGMEGSKGCHFGNFAVLKLRRTSPQIHEYIKWKLVTRWDCQSNFWLRIAEVMLWIWIADQMSITCLGELRIKFQRFHLLALTSTL